MTRRPHFSVLAVVLLLTAAAQAQITAPEKVGLGELLVVNSNAKVGQSIVWDILEPVDLKHELFPLVVRETVDGGAVVTTAVDDAIMVCSTGIKPGWIRLSCYTIDWAQQRFSKQRVDIKVEGETPPGPEPPGPDPPTPSTFSQQVKQAFTLVTKSREVAGKLGSNYRSVAAQAAANPSAWDPASMSDVVKTKHAEVLTTTQMADWQPFWPALAKAFVALKLNATDLPGHIKAFNEVADVLEATGSR